MKSKKKRHNSKNHKDSDTEDELVSSTQSRKPCMSNMEALLQWSLERCEFCEIEFNNKYEMLVHNAKHIIIPLLQQQIHECPECLHHFTSIESLEWHTINKHPEITRKSVPKLLQSFIKKEPAILVNKSQVNDVMDSKESLLQSFVKREPVTVLTKENFLANTNVIYEISDDSNEKSDTDVKMDIVKTETMVMKQDCVNNYKPNYYGFENDLKYEKPKIKERLRFEDEIDDPVINDLTTDCKVNLEIFDDTWINSIQKPSPVIELEESSNSQDVVKKNVITFGTKPNVETAVEFNEGKSVHYDDLMVLEEYNCSRCNRSFPNRYTAVIHETTHLTYKRRRLPLLCRICDWYVSHSPMGLKAHQKRQHPDRTSKPGLPTKCVTCGLSYMCLNRHLRNYHQMTYCHRLKCHKTFETSSELEDHKFLEHGTVVTENHAIDDSQWNSRIVKICDICRSFLKNTANYNYEHFGEFSKLGERQACERCYKYFFSLTVVHFRSRKLQKHNEVVHHKKKVFTNEDRLKNVRQRLKKLKNLNKF